MELAADIMTADAVETGEGDSEPLKGPLRRCLVTREVKPKAELLRFVIGPDSRLLSDPAERLPGRGLWLSAGRDIVGTAVAKGLFAKAAGQRVNVPADLAGQVERLLRPAMSGPAGLGAPGGPAAHRFREGARGFEGRTRRPVAGGQRRRRRRSAASWRRWPAICQLLRCSTA